MSIVNKKILSLLITSMLSLGCMAQKIAVEGIISGSDLQSSQILISPFNSTTRDTLHLQLLDSEKKQYQLKGEVSMATDSLYQLIGILCGRQLLQPICLVPGEKLYMTVEDGRLQCNTSAENRALSAFSRIHFDISRRLWEEGEQMDVASVEQLLGRYHKEAEAISKTYPCSQTVRQYLFLWAYTAMRSLYNNLSFITKKEDILQKIPATSKVLWPEELGKKQPSLLDNPLATYFYQTPQIIAHDLNSGTVGEKIKALYDNYQCPQVRNVVTDYILNSYISSFDYATHYEEGLAEINKLTEEYQLDHTYLRQFKMRQYSTKGAAFPKEVELIDSNGKQIDFSSFRNKIVYIDLWASWCKPCIGEIPHLQRIEKELANRQDIVFVSISIDQSMTAWKKKMEELNLHGNQLIDSKGRLSQYLNIKSIPFFLIYDKEGKLLRYGAPRPSTGDRLKKLLEDLR